MDSQQRSGTGIAPERAKRFFMHLCRNSRKYSYLSSRKEVLHERQNERLFAKSVFDDFGRSGASDIQSEVQRMRDAPIQNEVTREVRELFEGPGSQVDERRKRLEELERKIADKLAEKRRETYDHDIEESPSESHEPSAKAPDRDKEKRIAALEKRVQQKLLEDQIKPLQQRLDLIKGEYARIKRDKTYKNKKKKLDSLKQTIDAMNAKIKSIYG